MVFSPLCVTSLPQKDSVVRISATLKRSRMALVFLSVVLSLLEVGSLPTVSGERNKDVQSASVVTPGIHKRNLLQDDGTVRLVIGKESINDTLTQVSEGATVVLVMERAFNVLPETIEIRKPLVIQGMGKDGPRLSCPEQGGPVFRIWAFNVTLIDIAFAGCVASPAVVGEGKEGQINVLQSSFFSNTQAIESLRNSLVIKDCIFEGNGEGSTTVSSEGNTTIRDSNFTSNVAALGVSGNGEIYSFLDIQRSRFINNTLIFLQAVSELSRTQLADFWGLQRFSGGGAVSARSIDTVNLIDCTFENNTIPGGNGGAVKLDDIGNVRIERTRFFNCSTSEIGGAVFVRNNGFSMIPRRVEVVQSVFSENRARVGGGLFVLGGGTVFVEGSQFIRNRADDGGGGLFLWDCRGDFARNVLFEGNSAKRGGALVITDKATASSVQGTFNRNSAEDGGAIYILASGETVIGSLKIINVIFLGSAEFTNNTASKGGAIYIAEPNPLVGIGNSTFTHNKAALGGAIMIEDASSATIRDCQFLENEAIVGGGLLHLSKNLVQNELEVDKCIFERNVAKNGSGDVSVVDVLASELRGAGGGVAIAEVDMDATPRLKIRIESVNFTRNTAVVGGGFFVNSKGAPMEGVCNPWTCAPQIGLYRSRFTENRALEAGGAILATQPTHILLACNTTLGFVSERDVVRINNTEQMCALWTGNEVGGTGYGDVIASTVVGDLAVDPQEVSNQRSGVALDKVQIALVDALGQNMTAKAVTKDLRVEATPGENGLLVGGQTLSEITEGIAVFDQLLPIGSAGNHTIEFSVQQDTLKSTVMGVEIRKCGFGEIVDPTASGEECLRCPPGLYSFDPLNSSCDVCPLDGVCQGNVMGHLLVPKPGLWHSTPFSPQMIECLDESACSFENRTGKLQAFLAETGPVNLTVSEDSYPQCRKGHHGVMCGACDDDHGHIRVGKCAMCASEGIKGLIVGLVLLWSLVLVGISVRSNLAASRGLVEANADRAEPGRNLPALENAAPPQPFNSAKLKATETLKILVNYLQVTGIAVQINSNWTESVKRLLRFQDSAGAFSTDTAGSGLECSMPLDGHLPRSLGAVLTSIGVPFAMGVVAFLFWLALKLKKGAGCNYLFQRMVTTAWSILFLSYTILTRQFMRITFCQSADEEDGDFPYHKFSTAHESYWVADTDIRCFEGSHLAVLLSVAVPGLVIVTAGLPAALALFIYMNRNRLDDQNFKVSYWFLYQAYNLDSAFWDSVVMVRKAAMNAVVVFAQVLGPNLQGLLMMGILYLALGVHLWRQPFRHDLEGLNKLESTSLISTGLILFSGLYFHDPKNTSLGRLFLSVFVFVVSIFLLAYFVHKILEALEHYLDEELRKASQTPNKGLLRKAIQVAHQKLVVGLNAAKKKISKKRSKRQGGGGRAR